MQRLEVHALSSSSRPLSLLFAMVVSMKTRLDVVVREPFPALGSGLWIRCRSCRPRLARSNPAMITVVERVVLPLEALEMVMLLP